jgi:hypothetical protein
VTQSQKAAATARTKRRAPRPAARLLLLLCSRDSALSPHWPFLPASPFAAVDLANIAACLPAARVETAPANATMDGQAAFASAFHYPPPQQQQQQHPTLDGFGAGPLLHAPTSAVLSGGLPLPLRPPAALPALYNNHAANANANAYPHAHLPHHQHQQHHHHHPSTTAVALARPSSLRMATFAQDDAELARLQELSNKWESDASVSRLLHHADTSAAFRVLTGAGPTSQRTSV